MNLLIPGKTFLAGEYSVLVGGSALGLATKPCFEIEENTAQGFLFHQESPAGRYLLKKNQSSKVVQIKDPYSQQGINGGFGKSTAEFLAVARPELTKNNFSSIRKAYLDLHVNEKIKPSGADLAFQFFGQVCLANLSDDTYQSQAWPFAELNFLVVATGLKIATFQHLNELGLSTLSHLPAESDKVIKGFLKKDQNAFLSSLANWVDVLARTGLTHSHSVELKNSLLTNKNILLVKPCGALGADVLLVFCETNKTAEVRQFVQNKNLKVVADANDLCDGMVSYVD